MTPDPQWRRVSPWGLWVFFVVMSFLFCVLAASVIHLFDGSAWDYPTTHARANGLRDVVLVIALVLAPWLTVALTRPARRRRYLLGGLPGLVVLAAVGISMVHGPSGNPDPGNRLLHLVESDPLVARVPPGAAQVQRKVLPAQYQQNAFESSGWDGPGVQLTFSSSAPVRQVYAYYARLAKAEGWSVKSEGHLHVPDEWTKTLPGYGTLYLSVFDLQSVGTTTSFMVDL